MIHNWRGLHTLKQSNSWAIHIISPQGNNILAITNYWSSSMSGMALELIWWSVPIQSLKTLVPAVSCTFLRGNWVHWFLNCFPEQLFKQWLSTGEVAELGLLLSLRANCEVMRLLEEVNFTLRFHDMRYTSDYILLQLLVYFPIKSPNKLGFRWRGFLFNGEVETILFCGYCIILWIFFFWVLRKESCVLFWNHILCKALSYSYEANLIFSLLA